MDSHQLDAIPSSPRFVSCGTFTLGTQEPSKALLVAGGGQTRTPEASAGTCKFRVNDADDPGVTQRTDLR